MTNVRVIRQHLEILQEIFANALNQSSRRSDQPAHITIPLRPHQLAAAAEMRRKELAFQTGYSPNDEEIMYSKYAIYGDRAGVGKTLTVLAHISQMSTYALTAPQKGPQNILHDDSTPGLFSLRAAKSPETPFDSLIVVPFAIYRQWHDVIKNNTSLKANFLKTQRDLDKDSLIPNIRSSHITLISNTLLNPLMRALKLKGMEHAKWRRVFYDEADTIKISSGCAHPNALMTWYISSNFTNLVLADGHYSSYIFRQLPPTYIESLVIPLQEIVNYHVEHHPSIVFFKTESHSFFGNHLKSKHPLRSHLVIVSSDEFVDDSAQLPLLLQQTIRCRAPLTLDYTIPAHIKDMLHAGDIKEAFKALGVSTSLPITFSEAVTHYYTIKIQVLNEKLAVQGRPASEVAAITEKIRAAETDIQRVQTKLAQFSKEVCTICYDPPTNPVVIPCCFNVFCGSCILSWMVRTTACPLCRQPVLPQHLASITEDERQVSPRDTSSDIKLDKTAALLKILQDNPEGKFLIFSRFDNPLANIQETIQEHYPSQTLQGGISAAKQIADFESGITKILLANSHTAVAGLNIPTATHVILLHKMAVEEEKNILGRSYRLGRTAPLNYIKLLNERE